MRRSLAHRVFVVALLITSASCSVSERAAAQVQDAYRGTARSSVDATEATLEWSVFAKTDTIITGWLRIGKPLAATGLAFCYAPTKDSLVILSISATGDSIVWFSHSLKGSLGGSYKIIGGQYKGQTGEWHLDPAPVTSSSLLIGCAIVSGLLITGLLVFIAARSNRKWWRWRLATPLPAFTPSQEQRLARVEGWLSWFVLSCVVSFIVMLTRLSDVGETLGHGVWMLGAAVPAYHPLLFLEATQQVFSLSSIVIGLLLMIRRSSITPAFWVLSLVISGAYTLIDLIAASELIWNIRHIMGEEMGRAFEQGAQSATTTNGRTLLFAVAWSAYWIQSKRVRVRFAPNDIAVASAALGDVLVRAEPVTSP
jgi:hypothetical protein